MAKPLTKEQKELLKAITQELRRETALAFISLGYTNQTQAYLNACKSIKKTPSKNPHTSASEILNYPNVLAFIDSVKLVTAEEANIDAKYVLKRLIEIDTLDVVDILDDTGCMKAIRDWPKSWRTSISGLDIQEMLGDDITSVIKKIKWPDKLRNLELLGKHVDIKAWEKEGTVLNTTNNIMPVPSVDNIDDWENAAQSQQSEILKRPNE